MGEAAVMNGLDDPGPIQLDDLGGDDWVSLFGNESNEFDNLELLPDTDFGLLDADLPNAVSPASSLTQLSGGDSSSPTREESSGSGYENCKSDEERGNHSPASSQGSQKAGRIKRSGKRKISADLDAEEAQQKQDEGEIDEEDVKRRARLMRNRESAQLSRQRKKAYVDDLEDRVRMLNSTVQELNNTIALISAENVSLRSQLAYFYQSNGAARPGSFPPAAPPPGPHMGMPMYPYPGGFTAGLPMRTAPAVPIPRLKTPASSVKSVKRAKISKEEASKASGKPKKLAAVAALGLLCVMMVCLPVQWGVRPLGSGGFSSISSETSRVGGRVLMSLESGTSYRQLAPPSGIRDHRDGGGSTPGGGWKETSKATVDGSIFPASVSVTGDGDGDRFSASLILPRDDKLVKLDGNLIVQAVMAGDRANTQVAVVKPDRFQTLVAEAVARQKSLPSSDHRALPSSTTGSKDVLDDLAGAVLGTGVCKEVFQFEVSPESAAGENSSASSMRKRSGYHRRSLSAVPLPPLPTKERNNGTDGLEQPSSMVVSILTSPEAGPVKRDPKQVFVVVLLNGVKYVTYSCMLPLQPRLVTE